MSDCIENAHSLQYFNVHIILDIKLMTEINSKLCLVLLT